MPGTFQIELVFKAGTPMYCVVGKLRQGTIQPGEIIDIPLNDGTILKKTIAAMEARRRTVYQICAEEVVDETVSVVISQWGTLNIADIVMAEAPIYAGTAPSPVPTTQEQQNRSEKRWWQFWRY